MQVAVLSCGDYYDAQFVKLFTIFMVQLQVRKFGDFSVTGSHIGCHECGLRRRRIDWVFQSRIVLEYQLTYLDPLSSFLVSSECVRRPVGDSLHECTAGHTFARH